MDTSTRALRALQAVGDRGSFTAAAAALGATQSSVSRQVAALERQVGARLFERSPSGVRPTAAGRVLLRQAAAAMDALDQVRRELSGAPALPVLRVGHVPVAGAGLLPAALRLLSESEPPVHVVTREGSTPALIRGLRSGSLSAAVITSRPPHRSPDALTPGLRVLPLGDVALAVAVHAHGPLGGRAAVPAPELARSPWISSPYTRGEPSLGVWPGLPGQPRPRHVTPDWMTKLALVAAGLGVTTVPRGLLALPAVVDLVDVAGLPPETRRIAVASPPGHPSPAVARLLDALAAAASPATTDRWAWLGRGPGR